MARDREPRQERGAADREKEWQVKITEKKERKGNRKEEERAIWLCFPATGITTVRVPWRIAKRSKTLHLHTHQPHTTQQLHQQS